MNRLKLISILIILILSACKSMPQTNVANYSAKGNLESPKPAACVPINKLTNKQNPVDIFTGLANCLAQENYTLAAELYFAGMSYGYFDTKRVSDRTAHQAISVLRMNLFGAHSKEVLAKLQIELNKILSDNASICKSLNKLGTPKYNPTYMIQHGMGAFTGQSTKDGLVANFDSTSAWNDSLATMVKCIK